MTPEEIRYVARCVRSELTAMKVDLLHTPKSEIERVIANAIRDGRGHYAAYLERQKREASHAE